MKIKIKIEITSEDLMIKDPSLDESLATMQPILYPNQFEILIRGQVRPYLEELMSPINPEIEFEFIRKDEKLGRDHRDYQRRIT